MALATNTTPGEIQLAGDLAGNNDATAPELTDLGIVAGQYTYPKITVDAKGRITAITAGDPNEFSALLPTASTTTAGVVQAGTGLSVSNNDTAGYQEIVFGTAVDGSEATGLNTCAEYHFTAAVDFGAPQILELSGTNLTTINGVLNEISTNLVGGTASIVGGVVRITSDTTGNASLIEISDAKVFECMINFSSVDPLVIGTSGCTMNTDLATVSQPGVVKIGSGIDIDGNGVISTAIATTTTLGTVKIGSGLTIDGAGLLSATTVPDATTSSKGVVQIGAGVEVASGVISATVAENATKGIVKSANTDNITITAGSIDVGANVALLDTNNNWTTAQVVAPSALSIAGSPASVAIDANLSNNFTLTMTSNAILSNPTNLAAGGRYTFVIQQDISGGKVLSYDIKFKFKNGSDTTLSAGADDINILTCVSDGTDLYCALAKEFV